LSSESFYGNIIKPIRHIDELVAIEQIWNNIYNTVVPNSIFISFEYIMLWYKSFVKPDQVRVYPIYNGNLLIGFLPLYIAKKRGVRSLSSLTNLHSSHPFALITAGQEYIFIKNCFNTLFSDKTGWDILNYKYFSFQIHPDLDELKLNKYRMKEDIKPTYTISLSNTFDEYINNHLKKNTRHNFKAAQKKLSQTSSYVISHYMSHEAVALWPMFLSIEDSGWKGLKGSSLAKLPINYRTYYEGLIGLLSKSNNLHLYFLNVENKPVSGFFCYTSQEILHCWKMGYIEEYSSFSPLIILLLFAIEDLIKNFPEIKRAHLFPEDFGFKHRYVNEKSYFTNLNIFNRTTMGTLLYVKNILKGQIKRLPGAKKMITLIRNNKCSTT
jgi:CelD/BcsL family acetyltransferase involved in cellulose biosynthesis